MVRIQRHVKPVRIAAFGSLHHGLHVLSECLVGPIAVQLRGIGLATDHVETAFVSRERRIRQYPQYDSERTMVERPATPHGLAEYKERVKTPAFYRLYEEEWQYDARLFSHSRLGFFNLHQCVKDGWPSAFAGSNLFQALLDARTDHTVIAMHEVNDRFDTGTLRALSAPIFFPPGSTVVDLHRISLPIAAKFAARSKNFSIPKTYERHSVLLADRAPE